MRSPIDTRSIATSWIFLVPPAFSRIRPNASISFQTDCSAKGASGASFDERHPATEHVAPLDRPPAQLLGRVLVLLVLEQPPDELLARVEHLPLLLGPHVERLRRGDQLARLQVGERRRHDQVVRRHVERHRLHEIEVLQVLLGDEGDRECDDVDLVRLAEVQEQVERSLELRERDRGRGRRPRSRGHFRHRDPLQRIGPELNEVIGRTHDDSQESRKEEDEEQYRTVALKRAGNELKCVGKKSGQHGRAVERRQRDEIEEHEGDVERKEIPDQDARHRR